MGTPIEFVIAIELKIEAKNRNAFRTTGSHIFETKIDFRAKDRAAIRRAQYARAPTRSASTA